MQKEVIEKQRSLKPKGSSDTYIEGVGMRKTAVARVRIFESKENEFLVNARSLEEYFAKPNDRVAVRAPLNIAETDKKFFVSVIVRGSGVSAQAEAIRHGLSRALEKLDPDLRPTLKKAGCLKRDPREVERKKFGLRKARKKEQWSKR